MRILIALLGLLVLMPTTTLAQTEPDPLLLAPTYIDEQVSINVAANTTSTVGWTYTVPAGRVFRLEGVKVMGQSNVSGGQGWVATTNLQFLALATSDPVQGNNGYIIDNMNGPMYFPAGTVFTGNYINSNSSATFFTIVLMHGTEFSAP